MSSVLTAVLGVTGAAVAAVVLVEASHWAMIRIGRRSALAAELAKTMHRPFLVTVTLFAIQQALRVVAGEFPGRAEVLHLLVLLCIGSLGWLVAALLLVLEDLTLARWRTDVPDNLRRRRIKTQVVMLRRVTVAAIVILTLGVMLMTFPGIRALGASVLASAGLVSVIAALAAQSTLGNVFAGLQLAFSDAIRVDDVVVVEQEWGRIEEITLTYVAVQIWDDRRLILPTSYFTTKPFQNWTRSSSAVLGTAEIDVDWSTPIEPLRTELRRVCEGSDLWDERVCVLQVTEAIGGTIRLRALVSAADAGALWDLRCLVRERLVAWMWENQRGALPRMRTQLDETDDGVAPVRQSLGTRRTDVSPDARVFSGGDDAEARGAAFGGADGHDDTVSTAAGVSGLSGR
ncbi:small-conductance mechanosensitive channel [Actinoplanes octamycinicus]|uniref:Small-conductance mechanosensitive channel n=1 Tax=Actinoplanes octamycinicus TaxID=135948 RepID=A0A7W7H7R2_9ACTN|nr:mechanosensitive ion channel domain-containing protein [Actinoplanes octamycinicus]MBB4745566.1 small-conductance mechanosensitive channel [Actinoplanes octamycinicus]GIE56409.1 mechanosensitive ion channel protein MscS [Actinoplanes octamycinicus]